MSKKNKPQYPPQGGEARICGTLCVALVLFVLSAVAMIYSTVIVYLPSWKVLKSNFKGPAICTTITTERHLQGIEKCQGWSSCEEWCLGKSPDSCSHIMASVRNPGRDLIFDQCQISQNVVCSQLDDLEKLNCKIFGDQFDTSGMKGAKEKCMNFNDVIVSCEGGICKNVSQAYKCSYKSAYDDILQANNGLGTCGCQLCESSQDYMKEECSEDIIKCLSTKDNALKNSNKCANLKCMNCWDTCHSKTQCFTLSSTRDPPNLGIDEWQRPIEKFFKCGNGYCSEVYDLNCIKKCGNFQVDSKKDNFVIFSGEQMLTGNCQSISNTDKRQLISLVDYKKFDLLLTSCTSIEIQENQVLAKDCINGTWLDFRRDFEKKKAANYSMIRQSFLRKSEDKDRQEIEIPNEKSLILIPKTRVMVNLEGCVNTLSKECNGFFKRNGKDGRNSTSRSIYPCYYDLDKPDLVLIDFNKEKSYMLLLISLVVPATIFLITLIYICFCNKFVKVAHDGRMRLKCCGKYISGIGNVNTRLDF